MRVQTVKYVLSGCAVSTTLRAVTTRVHEALSIHTTLTIILAILPVNVNNCQGLRTELNVMRNYATIKLTSMFNRCIS